jgi:hypothetical protein
MKLLKILATASASLITGLLSVLAQPAIPSDGTDGDLLVSSGRVIDLGLARAGSWNQPNSTHSGDGIYDPEQWAVVFKYRSVRIGRETNSLGEIIGARLSFRNHASRAPVVWLVQGDVEIDGILDLSGQPFQEGPESLIPTEPGPGGFRGGPVGPLGIGAGLGPGAGHNTAQGAYASRYGNPRIMPLIGGSGGSGGNSGWLHFQPPSGGGGAILIAASGTIRLNGKVLSNGGGGNAGGSGGGIRLIASRVEGNGEVSCLPDGRIRVEAVHLSSTVRLAPETIAIHPGDTPVIWPPANSPRVRIEKIDDSIVPAGATAPLVTSADVAIEKDSPVTITLHTQNFPLEGVVELRVAQKFGGAQWVRAIYASGDFASARWTVSTPFARGYSTLQARATAP